MNEGGASAESARSEPQLSIVMPVYNAMPYLPKAVHDVLYQTGVSLELLAVDDGSNDGSFEFLQQARRTGWHCTSSVFHRSLQHLAAVARWMMKLSKFATSKGANGASVTVWQLLTGCAGCQGRDQPSSGNV